MERCDRTIHAMMGRDSSQTPIKIFRCELDEGHRGPHRRTSRDWEREKADDNFDWKMEWPVEKTEYKDIPFCSCLLTPTTVTPTPRSVFFCQRVSEHPDAHETSGIAHAGPHDTREIWKLSWTPPRAR